MNAHQIEDNCKATAILEFQANSGDPFSMGILLQLNGALRNVEWWTQYGYASMTSRENTRAPLQINPKDTENLVYAMRKGSRSAERAWRRTTNIESFVRNVKGDTFHGTREGTYLRMAFKRPDETGDLGLLRQLLVKSMENSSALSINTLPYPGEPFIKHQDGTISEYALHVACTRGYLKIVEYLIGNGADINFADLTGETPLLHACRAGRVDVAGYLLIHGAIPKPCGRRGETPLHWLGSFADEDIPLMASVLLGAGADIHAMARGCTTEGNGRENFETSFASGTPLHRAVTAMSFRAVESLLEHGASPLCKSSTAPYHSPITLACTLSLSLDYEAVSWDTTSTIDLGVSSGASSRSPRDKAKMKTGKGQIGSGRCRWADLVPQDSILRCLLEHIPPNGMNQYYWEPFARRRLPEFLLDANPLTRVAVNGDLWVQAIRQTMSLLKSYGEKFLDKETGFSLLHLACDAGNYEVVEQLLEVGEIDVNHAMPGIFTYIQPPLFYALRSGHHAIVDLLLRKGASTHQRFHTDYVTLAYHEPQSNLSPFFSALFKGHEFDKERASGLRTTFLHTCAVVGSPVSVVCDLINRGARVNSYDSNWQSPLYLAIRNCNFDLADLFLDHRARLTELRDDLTLFGQLAEEGFAAPIRAVEYILKNVAKGDPTSYMANFKTSQTVFHVLMSSDAVVRNDAWAEELMRLFFRHLPDKRLLNIQSDGNADTALHIAVRKANLLGVQLLLEHGADPVLPTYADGMPLDIAIAMAPQFMTVFPADVLADPKMAADYVTRREDIKSALVEGGAKCIKDPKLVFLQQLCKGNDLGERDLMKKMMKEEPYEIPARFSNAIHPLRQALKVDLKSVNEDDIYYEGAVREIVEDIVQLLRPVFARKSPEFIKNPDKVVAEVLVNELEKSLEFSHRHYPRHMRLENQLAWVLAGFATFSLNFDTEAFYLSTTLHPYQSDGTFGVPNLMRHEKLPYAESTKGTRIITMDRVNMPFVSAFTELDEDKPGSKADGTWMLITFVSRTNLTAQGRRSLHSYRWLSATRKLRRERKRVHEAGLQRSSSLNSAPPSHNLRSRALQHGQPRPAPQISIGMCLAVRRKIM